MLSCRTQSLLKHLRYLRSWKLIHIHYSAASVNGASEPSIFFATSGDIPSFPAAAPAASPLLMHLTALSPVGVRYPLGLTSWLQDCSKTCCPNAHTLSQRRNRPCSLRTIPVCIVVQHNGISISK